MLAYELYKQKNTNILLERVLVAEKHARKSQLRVPKHQIHQL